MAAETRLRKGIYSEQRKRRVPSCRPAYRRFDDRGGRNVAKIFSQFDVEFLVESSRHADDLVSRTAQHGFVGKLESAACALACKLDRGHYRNPKRNAEQSQTQLPRVAFEVAAAGAAEKWAQLHAAFSLAVRRARAGRPGFA